MPENPQRIRRESAENPLRIRWESFPIVVDGCSLHLWRVLQNHPRSPNHFSDSRPIPTGSPTADRRNATEAGDQSSLVSSQSSIRKVPDGRESVLQYLFFLDLLGIHQNPHSVAGNLFQPSQRIPIHPKVIRRQLIGGRCSVSLWKHAEEYRRFTRPIRSTSGASARESRMVRCQDRRRKPRVAIDILTPLGRFSNWWIFLIFAG